MKSKQNGITFLSFIIILAVLGFFAFMAMRLIPVYIEFYSASKDIKASVQTPGASTRTIQEYRTELERRFDISYVDNINLNKDIKLINEGSQKKLQLKYELRKPFIYNLDFVAKFDKSFPLNSQEGIE